MKRAYKTLFNKIAIAPLAMAVPVMLSATPHGLVEAQPLPLQTSVNSSQVVAQAEGHSIDAKADELLQATSDLLSSTEAMSFTAQESRDVVTSTGVLVQVLHTIEYVVERPNRMWMNVNGDIAERTFWNDGDRFTLFDRVNNIYATEAATGDLTETVERLRAYDVEMPLAGAANPNLYEQIMEGLQGAYYTGLSLVNGTPCHHLVMVDEAGDWQLWIRDGDVPVPCRMSLAYKNREGVPRITTTFTNWNLNPVISSDQFSASIPVGAEQVEFGQPVVIND
jgi:hypothetical protein